MKTLACVSNDNLQGCIGDAVLELGSSSHTLSPNGGHGDPVNLHQDVKVVVPDTPDPLVGTHFYKRSEAYSNSSA